MGRKRRSQQKENKDEHEVTIQVEITKENKSSFEDIIYLDKASANPFALRR